MEASIFATDPAASAGGQPFDAVLMLTRSNWHTEPRSNRYHYATRFARRVPVLFVQLTGRGATGLRVEANVHPGMDLIHVDEPISAENAMGIAALLRARAIRNPLVWVYAVQDYGCLLDLLRAKFTVLHATEDFLFYEEHLGRDGRPVYAAEAETIRRELWRIDLLVGVSEGVVRSYVERAGYRGDALAVTNGCDASYYLDLAERAGSRPRPTAGGVAIYQGGINFRLDFDLLRQVVRTLPDWQFWFCGRADESLPSWTALKSEPNVRHLGDLSPDRLGEAMSSATVGLIPFLPSPWIRNSLPLKAYEYVACGLPVVTVPIDALAGQQELFRVAGTAEEFARAIVEVAPGRDDPALRERRRLVALRNSYDERFESVKQAIARGRVSVGERRGSLNVAILYDERSTHIGTVYEHLDAFRKYSRNSIVFVPATSPSYRTPPQPPSLLAAQLDLSVFDVVIVHYAVRLSLESYFVDGMARQLERFGGLKMLFIQDEYDATETARRWMERLSFDVVYTCVPRDGLEFVYPAYRFPATEFLPTLTGYVPEAYGIERLALPMRERRIRIGYRGRALAFGYGQLGHEKYRIGVDMRRLAQSRGVPVDIEVLDSKRIYGDDWYRFVGSVRAVLGTESGANVFDFDGTIHRSVADYLKRKPRAKFEQVHRDLIARHDGKVRMNQISPKIFEAIRLRTALVLFEGSYSGVVQPDVHFIPLAKDYSNADEVFRKLEDLDFLETLTERAYRDIVESGRYSYRAFVESVDADIAERVVKGPNFELFATPILARDRGGNARVLVPSDPIGYSISSRILAEPLQREQMADLLHPASDAGRATPAGCAVAAAPSPVDAPVFGHFVLGAARGAWRLMPSVVRRRLVDRMRDAIARAQDGSVSSNWDVRLLRRLWRMVPGSLRSLVLGRLRAR